MSYELEDELELEEEAMELEPLFARRGPNAYPFSLEVPISAPIFDAPCVGCPPGITVAQCRRVIRQAIIEAIKMANNAASKLEAAVKLDPSKRDKDAKETARLFSAFFGHDPRRVITWAGNED